MVEYEQLIADMSEADKQLFDTYIHTLWQQQNLNPRKKQCSLDIIIDMAWYYFQRRDDSINRGELA